MKQKLTIEGMHCAACANNIEKSLKKIPGIKEANVSLMTRKGFVECEKEIPESELSKAVARAGGYKLLKVEK